MEFTKLDDNTLQITTTAPVVSTVTLDQLNVQMANLVQQMNLFVTSQQKKIDDVQAKIDQCTSLGIVSLQANKVVSQINQII